ncbi:MAG: polymer-forming cytoskeletal protein [Desulfobacterales bacterium]|nr:polymer-forming cytoskeletal protein [Desulfobacterales bacterium]MBF0398954.1 polymer-forming cytoskeletal protein [Desulfobacterales bacterium]
MINTLLGHDTNIRGSLEFQGTIRIDGKVSGKILTNSGTLIIGENSVICADIKTDTIIIMGKVIGNIDAANRVEIHSGAYVKGDISTNTVLIKKGAFLKGRCKIIRKEDFNTDKQIIKYFAKKSLTTFYM